MSLGVTSANRILRSERLGGRVLLADVGGGDEGRRTLARSVVTNGFIAHELIYILRDLVRSGRGREGDEGGERLGPASSPPVFSGAGLLADDGSVPTLSLSLFFCFASLTSLASLDPLPFPLMLPNGRAVLCISLSLSLSMSHSLPLLQPFSYPYPP